MDCTISDVRIPRLVVHFRRLRAANGKRPSRQVRVRESPGRQLAPAEIVRSRFASISESCRTVYVRSTGELGKQDRAGLDGDSRGWPRPLCEASRIVPLLASARLSASTLESGRCWLQAALCQQLAKREECLDGQRSCERACPDRAYLCLHSARNATRGSKVRQNSRVADVCGLTEALPGPRRAAGCLDFKSWRSTMGGRLKPLRLGYAHPASGWVAVRQVAPEQVASTRICRVEGGWPATAQLSPSAKLRTLNNEGN